MAALSNSMCSASCTLLVCVQVVMVLKKELVRTQSKELERAGEYRQVLVQCVHKCAIKYPDVAAAVVHSLMEFLGDSQTVGASTLLCFTVIEDHRRFCSTLLVFQGSGRPCSAWNALVRVSAR